MQVTGPSVVGAACPGRTAPDAIFRIPSQSLVLSGRPPLSISWSWGPGNSGNPTGPLASSSNRGWLSINSTVLSALPVRGLHGKENYCCENVPT